MKEVGKQEVNENSYQVDNVFNLSSDQGVNTSWHGYAFGANKRTEVTSRSKGQNFVNCCRCSLKRSIRMEERRGERIAIGRGREDKRERERRILIMCYIVWCYVRHVICVYIYHINVIVEVVHTSVSIWYSFCNPNITSEGYSYKNLVEVMCT